jgi:hypothetical protein
VLTTARAIARTKPADRCRCILHCWMPGRELALQSCWFVLLTCGVSTACSVQTSASCVQGVIMSRVYMFTRHCTAQASGMSNAALAFLKTQGTAEGQW